MTQLLADLNNLPGGYQLIWLVTCLVFCWTLESLTPLFQFRYQRIKHNSVNFVFLFTTILTKGLLALVTIPIFLWVESQQLGLLNSLEWPVWFELLIAFLMLDLFVQYGIHYVLHHVSWMWRFHTVHHSDTHVDASTGTRHHPGDMALREVALIVAVLLFGIPLEFYVFYQLVTTFFAYFTHANLRLPKPLDRWLSYVLVTPDMHKFHHHFEAPWTDSNFGNVFSIWDRMFGTLIYEDVDIVQYGLDVVDSEKHQNLAYQYALPFTAAVSRTNSAKASKSITS